MYKKYKYIDIQIDCITIWLSLQYLQLLHYTHILANHSEYSFSSDWATGSTTNTNKSIHTLRRANVNIHKLSWQHLKSTMWQCPSPMPSFTPTFRHYISLVAKQIATEVGRPFIPNRVHRPKPLRVASVRRFSGIAGGSLCAPIIIVGFGQPNHHIKLCMMVFLRCYVWWRLFFVCCWVTAHRYRLCLAGFDTCTPGIRPSIFGQSNHNGFLLLFVLVCVDFFQTIGI